MAIGLRLVSQPYPQFVPDAISVRQAGDLPTPSFTLHLAMDALGLSYTLPATGRVRDFHPLDYAHAGRTKK
ncbi:hypothetical protein SDC9_150548 [bioreactor metagenome]|uniref:Uncharacterized protein n=1 Tax=bioreactor metagenome TaxID=1076179 RepID=A0A645EMT5_9ZZZZ